MELSEEQLERVRADFRVLAEARRIRQNPARIEDPDEEDLEILKRDTWIKSRPNRLKRVREYAKEERRKKKERRIERVRARALENLKRIREARANTPKLISTPPPSKVEATPRVGIERPVEPKVEAEVQPATAIDLSEEYPEGVIFQSEEAVYVEQGEGFEEADETPGIPPLEATAEPGPTSEQEEERHEELIPPQVDWDNFLRGFFLVSRSYFRSEVYYKPPLFRDIWMWLIGNASFQDTRDGDFIFRQGELFTTREEIAEGVRFYQHNTKVKPSVQQVRDVLDWLVENKMIEKKFVKKILLPHRSHTAPTSTPPRLPNYCAAKEPTQRTDLYRSQGLRIKIINYTPYQSISNYVNRLKNRPKEPTHGEEKEPSRNRVGTELEPTPPRQPLMDAGSYPSKELKNVKNKNHYVEGDEPLRLSSLLLEEIRKNKSDFKGPADLQSWAQVFDLMLRRDHRKPETIERVIKWVQSDRGDGTGSWKGWAPNILSPRKLREKFDEVEMKMEGSVGRKQKSW